MNRKVLVLPALLGLIGSAALVGCDSSYGSGGGGDPIVIGTTDGFSLSQDTPAPLDPATSYEASAWNIFYNTFQMLLRYPRNGTKPQPDAAKSCRFTDQQSEAYSCTLRDGLKFSNGDPLTSRDVKFSIDRTLKMNSDVGPASLLAGVSKVETPDDRRIVFYLKAPDATFPFKLATPAAAIVDSKVYQADKPYTGLRIVGSGPYDLDSFDASSKAVFSANTNYNGAVTRQNSKIEIRFFKSPGSLYKAVTGGSVDVTTVLTSDQVANLQKNPVDGVQIADASGNQAHYMFLDTSAGSPFRKRAVRVALAQSLDHEGLAREVYQRTVQPLYSVVPQGVISHRNSFYNDYGDGSVSAAAATLRKAGIDTPVKFTYTYRSVGGSSATAEAEWLREHLAAGGLFDVTVKQVPVGSFVGNAVKGQYQAYGLSWVPDFPDADNYIAPFFGDNFFHLKYVSGTIKSALLPSTRRQADRTETTADFERMQDIVAHDVPLVPLWQTKQYIASRDGVTGVEWALNSTSTIQFWELGKGQSG
jgi:peptide/nickel transport system substrate-binding protein